MKTTGRSPNDIVLDQLEQLAPQSILTVSGGRIPALEHYIVEHPAAAVTHLKPESAQHELDEQSRFDLALVADALEHLDHRCGAQLLGRLRNVHSNHLLVLITEPAPLGQTDLFGLGLVCAARAQHPASGQILNVYSYDIASYNHVRDWNNPRYWANPENWGKYWW